MTTTAPMTVKVDPARRQSADQRNWFIVRDTANGMKRYRRPSALEEKQREACRLCRVCCYLRGGRIGGAAMTNYVCASCGNERMWNSTAVPAMCDACSDVNRICQQCYGDRDAERVKLNAYPKAIR